MSREPRRFEYTICTAVAPEAVFTVRTNGDTGPPYGPQRPPISVHIPAPTPAKPQVKTLPPTDHHDREPSRGGSAAIHQQIADGYNFDCDFAGQARSAFALDGTGTVLFEVRGQSDDWGQRQLVQLVQVVLAGVLGMAERMADGSVDTLNGDDFYDLPKYW
jgi:hypothetical protein